MNLSIEERWSRIKSSSHVIRLEDSSVYEVKQMWMVDDNVIFLETLTDVWYQDIDVLTLEEAVDAERFLNKVKDWLCLGK